MNLAVEMHINMSKLCFKEIFFWQQIYKLDAEKPKEHSGDCWDTVSKREDREADKKGRDITIIDIGAKAAFADYMIIASGSTERQVKALCDEVEDKLAENGVFVKHIEGKNDSGWILMDYGDIIVNLLTVDLREKYNIEKVWADCEFLNLED